LKKGTEFEFEDDYEFRNERSIDRFGTKEQSRAAFFSPTDPAECPLPRWWRGLPNFAPFTVALFTDTDTPFWAQDEDLFGVFAAFA
jgi:hypothetical protein